MRLGGGTSNSKLTRPANRLSEADQALVVSIFFAAFGSKDCRYAVGNESTHRRLQQERLERTVLDDVNRGFARSVVLDDQNNDSQRSLRARPRLESVKTRARAMVQHGIDTVQFRFDSFPRMLYQPLPWIGKNQAGRAEGTLARWQVIQPLLEENGVTSAVDVGCQAGFFTISLGERNITTLGIDIDRRSLRLAHRAAQAAGVRNVGWCHQSVDQQTIALVPSADAVLALSVWHHWVWAYGLAPAGDLLSELWERSAKILFFETGESEMPPEFGLPDMGTDQEAWLTSYLAKQCPGGTVSPLGRHKAFGIDGNETHNIAHRHLFAVTRNL